MKIALDTPDKLILDDRPWFLGGLLALLIVIFTGFGLNALWAGRGAGLLGLGGALLWTVALLVFVRRTTVTFERTGQAVTRSVVSFRGGGTKLWALGELNEATVETRLSRNSSKRGRSTTTPLHRPVLHWRDGSPPLALLDAYVSGDGAEKVVSAINRWLNAAPPLTPRPRPA